MVSLIRCHFGSRRLAVRLAAAWFVGLLALAGLTGIVSAHARGPDVAVIFLVDESLSSAAIARGEKETLYNTVRFLNSALAIACQSGQCQTGVVRFSAKSAQLVPLKLVEVWDERDFLRLDIGIQDRVDQSDFPAAFNETCRQIRRSTDAEKKMIVILTDGQIGSQNSPDIAPVQREKPTSRTAFIEEITEAVEFCGDSDIHLLTILLDPNDLGDQPNPNQNKKSYRDQERSMWRSWSESTRGAIFEAPTADDAQSVRNVVFSLGEILDLTMPEFVMPEDGKIDLGVISPYRGGAEFEIVGLKPFRVEIHLPDSGRAPADQIRQSQNRVTITVPLPQEGRWVAMLPTAATDDLFFVRPPVTYPMHLQPHLLPITNPIDQRVIPANGEVTLELTTVPVGGSTPVVIADSVITATLTSPLGLTSAVIFTADTNQGIYVAKPTFSDQRPAPGLYALSIPAQTIDDVVVGTWLENVVLSGDPFVLDWHFNPTTVYANSPFTLTIDLENGEMLALPPEFEITWTADHGGTITNKAIGQEIHPGQFQVMVDEAPGIRTTYKVGVGLIRGTSVLGQPFPSSAPVLHDVLLREKPTVVVPPTPSPKKGEDRNDSATKDQVWIQRVLKIILVLVPVLMVIWAAALWAIPQCLRRRKPLDVHRFVEKSLSSRVGSWLLRPIRPKLNQIQSARLEQVEESQINEAVQISLRRFRLETKLEDNQLKDIEHWDDITKKVLTVVNNSTRRLREVRNDAASLLFCDLLDKRQDSLPVTDLDLINCLYIQNFEPNFES